MFNRRLTREVNNLLIEKEALNKRITNAHRKIDDLVRHLGLKWGWKDSEPARYVFTRTNKKAK